MRRWKFVVAAIVTVLFIVPVAAVAATSLFEDVPDNSIFVNSINWMKTSGVTKGCNPPENTRYCPDGNVTREQMAAFMQRLAKNRVVDAGTLEGFTAAELKGGSGSIAAGAGGKYGSSDDPTLLYEDTITELGALSIAVPANGGVVNIDTSVMLDTEAPQTSSYVAVWLTWDKTCSSTDPSVAGATADLDNAWFANVPMNSGISASAGNHTIRLCAAAYHTIGSVTWVDAARISAVWVPTAMGGTVSPLGAGATESSSVFITRAKSGRDAQLSSNEG